MANTLLKGFVDGSYSGTLIVANTSYLLFSHSLCFADC